MASKQVLDVLELLDRPNVKGDDVAGLFSSRGLEAIENTAVEHKSGTMDFLKILIPGTEGRRTGGSAPTIGVVGMVGAIGAQKDEISVESTSDGVVATLSVGLELAKNRQEGERLSGDVILTTVMNPSARETSDSLFPMDIVCEQLVVPEMDAIISIEAINNNRIMNRRGIAISPTAKEGYVLKVCEGLASLQEQVTDQPPEVFPVTTQDITPWANELFHLSSIMQPSTVTDVPVVGVAITSETTVPELASGPTREANIEVAVRFVLEAAKAYTSGRVKLFDREEFDRLKRLYGTMSYLQAPRRVR